MAFDCSKGLGKAGADVERLTSGKANNLWIGKARKTIDGLLDLRRGKTFSS